MTRIDIISGFLGAGKTTLIQKLLKEALSGSQVVLIENEFGEIGIDGGFLQDAGIRIREMNSGCICCSLVGDFGTALKEVLDTYHPDRVLIEPSGVGKLSDVMKAVQNAGLGTEVALSSAVAVVDASKCQMYSRNFGEFFTNQIAYAGTVLLSRTDVVGEEKIKQALELIRRYNPKATVITTPLAQLDGKDLLAAMEGATDLERELMEQVKTLKEEEHHHHHHHPHDHDDHHDADEIFDSWGKESPGAYGRMELEERLKALETGQGFGQVLRAKGMVPDRDGGWLHFDFVPGQWEVRAGGPAVTGKVCVIGAGLRDEALDKLFDR